MGLFSKKEKVEFEATQVIAVGWMEYDENRKLVKIINGMSKKYIPVDKITDYSVKYGEKTYTKANLGKAVVGGAMFGVAGVILAGTHQEDYVKNITLCIRVDDPKQPFVFLPLTIGKMKMSAAKGIIKSADKMIAFLDTVTT